MAWVRIFVMGLFLALAGCDEMPMPAESSISVADQGPQYAVTVPLSRISLTIPKSDLLPTSTVRSGASASPRYFYLQGKELVVSGWFEPARLYKDPDQTLKFEFAKLQADGFGAPTNVEKMQIGPFAAVVYDLGAPGGNDAHVRASYLGKDTWIDLHVSVHTARPSAQARASVIEAVRGLSLQAKP